MSSKTGTDPSDTTVLEYGVITGCVCLFCLIVCLSIFALFQDLQLVPHNTIYRFSIITLNNDGSTKNKKRRKIKSTTKQKTTTKLTETLEDMPWESIFTVDPPTKPILPDPVPSRPTNNRLICKCCRDFTAKQNCQFSYCAKCCQAKLDSVCKAHKTGHLHASMVVNDAIQYGKYFDVDISYCNLKTCPAGLSSIGTQTVSLNLSNNRLMKLPDDIGLLSGLEELFLQYNHLTELPSSVCHLSHLVELDVKNNNLKHIPENIGSLDSLVILCFTNNQLTSLPSSIGQLIHLQELSIHSNVIKSLPSSICHLRELKCLYAGENKLQNLPDQFGNLVNLEELDLTGCELVSIPESLGCCLSLVRVWLSNNKLTKLPTRIGNLKNLKELHVRNNNLKVFPLSIKSLNLYTFTAQYNPVIKEHQISKLNYTPLLTFPSLLELSARAVTYHKLKWEKGTIPRNLHDMLTHRCGTCCLCGGPFFDFYSCRVSFHLVGVFYRLPLYEHHCSPHNPSSCD